MDFGALPPEINSARMYAGPGAGPMLAAAAAWDQLAADLHSGALSYQSAITGLTASVWRGPASAAMAAAASPYVTWMMTTAAQCEQVASQARAAVSAYESAFAMSVPPPLIAANRAQLMLLVATNFLGQNTPAIMATEAHYGQMWAQDAAAMYGYAGSSAAASTLSPFVPPQQATKQTGLAAQAAAIAQATGTTAATHAQTATSSLSAIPHALHSLASPTSSTSGLSQKSMSTASSAASAPTGALTGLTGTSSKGVLGGARNSTSGASGPGGLPGLFSAGSSASSGAADLGSDVGGLGADFFGVVPNFLGANGLAESGGLGALGGLGGLEPLGGPGALGPLSIGGAGASASIGHAASLGALSVPQSWADVATVSPISPASATAVPVSNFGAAPMVSAVGSAMPKASVPSQAGQEANAIQQLRFRFTVIPNSPMAG